jgi:hypothetical protein
MAHRSLVARGSLVVIVGLLAGLASCSQSPNSTPAAQSAAAPTATTPAATTASATGAVPAAAPMAAATAIASAQYSDDPSLRADLLEVKRVSGGALLIRWRLVDTAGSPQGAGLVAGAAPKAATYTGWSWADLYYTDPAENKKYGVLTDTEGNRLLDVYSGDVQPGQERDNWSKFPAPPASSTKVTIYIPKFPPFEDTPIS